jgi:hypothetical protein
MVHVALIDVKALDSKALGASAYGDGIERKAFVKKSSRLAGKNKNEGRSLGLRVLSSLAKQFRAEKTMAFVIDFTRFDPAFEMLESSGIAQLFCTRWQY